MMRKRVSQIATIFVLTFTLPLPADWLTFGHDPQRSGWAPEETKLTVQSVKNLELKWSVQLDNLPLALNALTAPVVARDVVTPSGIKTLVYVAGSSNHLFAVDASTGSVAWQRTFESFVKAKADSFYLCPNALNATPVIDRRQNLIFALAYDGRLFGLDLGTGSIKFGPFQFVPPFSKPWSLNLNDGFVYTTTSQACGGDRSGIYSMEVDKSTHRSSYETLVRDGYGAGMWSRGGAAIGSNGVLYVTTGDGTFDPSKGNYGSTFLAASTPMLNVIDYFSPLNRAEINKKDLDLPSGGHTWLAYQDYHLIVGGGKEAVVYLLNADSLGDKDHETPLSISPRLGNLSKVLEEKGVWGAPAIWKDEDGQPWVYITLWGDTSEEVSKAGITNGARPHGSIVAFQIEMDKLSKKPCLKLAWVSSDVNLPDAPAVANGVVFVVATGENPRQDKFLGKTDFKSEEEWKQNLLTTEERGAGTRPASLLALDAKTGKLLYQNTDAMKTWNHFGGIAIDDGTIYTIDHSSTLYCFGLRSR
ncbi:MAG: PQQ-binding-like beta-propeller repeat protein [Bryobacteraceae bacterium]